jgi:hypothetical protein
MDKTVIIKYQIKKTYCSCCGQKLPDPEVSNEREFIISLEDAIEWVDWNSAVKADDDFHAMVEEFVYNAISFWISFDADDHLLIDKSEFQKVEKFILKNIIN